MKAMRRMTEREFTILIIISYLMITACKPIKIASTTPITGAQVFQCCVSCHSDKDVDRPSAPSLFGVVNRPAAIRKDFFYSKALQNTNLKWDVVTLDEYLANPQQKVPGTFMIFAVPDANERKAVIEYLQTFKRNDASSSNTY